jgi:hypothetical protein
MRGILWLAGDLLVSQGISFMELVSQSISQSVTQSVSQLVKKLESLKPSDDFMYCQF